uniref:Integrase catalytic domain-containing protein n=1 Tax=Strongyloides papillosus TaxID=174720 RepID=A0A0N5BBB4_STREA
MNVYNIDEDSDDDSILYDSHYNECTVDVNAVVKSNVELGNANPGKRPRERPKKCIKVVKIAKRGRPKKSQKDKPERSENDVKPCKNSEIPQKKRRRGRPKKVVTVESDDESNHPLMELVENLNVFIDSFTRFTIIILCRSYSFDEVFQKIMDGIIWKHENLLSIRTDNRPNFKNEKLIEVFKTIGIKQEFSTIYHSRGNAICERALKWIQNTIAKLSKSKRERWDIYTQAVSYYYNTTVCSSHGFTPFYLHYMRHPNTGLETLLNIQKNYRVDKNPELVELIDVAKEAYKEAKWNIDRNIDRRPEGKYRENDLKVDEFVYVKFPDLTCGSKLALNWCGPYKILKVDENRITVINDKGEKKIVHFSNCKRAMLDGIEKNSFKDGGVKEK